MRLILIRHAKSAWDDPFVDDHARVLNARGRRSADAVGAWMQGNGYIPGQVLSSDSARTKETVQHMMAKWGAAPSVTFLRKLYQASPQTLLETLHTATAEVVAMVAHNPGIGSFASAMLDRVPDHSDFWRYPTNATLVMDFDIAKWKTASPGMGQAVDFIVPRDLTD